MLYDSGFKNGLKGFGNHLLKMVFSLFGLGQEYETSFAKEEIRQKPVQKIMECPISIEMCRIGTNENQQVYKYKKEGLYWETQFR